MKQLTRQDIIWTLQQAIAFHETGNCFYFVDEAKKIIEFMTGYPHELAPYAPNCTCKKVSGGFPKLDYDNCPIHKLPDYKV